MSEESQAVQTMVSAAEKGAEATARIALETGKGVLHTAKSIVALAAALIKSHPKSKGKIKLTKMVSQGKELVPFQILERDKATFHKLAKDYGITYVMVKNSKTQDGRVEVIAKAEDAGGSIGSSSAWGTRLPPGRVRKKTPCPVLCQRKNPKSTGVSTSAA